MGSGSWRGPSFFHSRWERASCVSGRDGLSHDPLPTSDPLNVDNQAPCLICDVDSHSSHPAASTVTRRLHPLFFSVACCPSTPSPSGLKQRAPPLAPLYTRVRRSVRCTSFRHPLRLKRVRQHELVSGSRRGRTFAQCHHRPREAVPHQGRSGLARREVGRPVLEGRDDDRRPGRQVRCIGRSRDRAGRGVL